MPKPIEFGVSVCVNQKTGDLEALYFQVRRGKVARTREIQANVLVDYDDAGHIMGIELLGPCHTTIIERYLEKKRAPLSVRRFVQNKIPAEFIAPETGEEAAHVVRA